jgi:hypothetical protein
MQAAICACPGSGARKVVATMTFHDQRLDRPIEPPEARNENMQDVLPPSQRGQDVEQTTHELVTESARPLTDEERKAADRDAPPGERVYAPASERVPRTVPGYRDVVENVDTATQERRATGTMSEVSSSMSTEEPSFTRVPRPSTSSDTPYGSTESQQDWMNTSSSGRSWLMPMGIGWLTLSVGTGVGIWLWLRWQRERNRPINRLRRQARQTAAQARQTAFELRERMPEFEMPDEATRPAIGLGTALLSAALLWWQQSQVRSRSRVETTSSRARWFARRAGKMAASSSKANTEQASRHLDRASRQADRLSRQAGQMLSETDWQQRLMQLKERWTPSRLEIENVSIKRH